MQILLNKNEIKSMVAMLEKVRIVPSEDKTLYEKLVKALSDEEENSAVYTKYRKAAKENHHEDGTTEIDDGAIVSVGNDPGAYVLAWVWVDAVEAGVMTEEERDAEHAATKKPEEDDS